MQGVSEKRENKVKVGKGAIGGMDKKGRVTYLCGKRVKMVAEVLVAFGLLFHSNYDVSQNLGPEVNSVVMRGQRPCIYLG